MKLVNLTPHVLKIYNEYEELVATIPPSGDIARVSVTRAQDGRVGNIPLFRTTYGTVEGLPGAEPDTLYIVSGMVRAAVPHRSDVWQPGELLRDANGRPVGAIGLSR